MGIIRKYFWQLSGTLLALAAIFATYNVFFLSRPIKQLEIIVDTTIPLIDIKPEVASEVQVRYKGQLVNNLVLLQARIRNSGNQPILESDYSRRLNFSFSPSYQLLDARAISSEPPNVGLIITTTNNQAEASPTLLNPGDTVTVRFLTININPAPTTGFQVDGRIIGVMEIPIIPSNTAQQPLFGSISVIGAIVATLFASILVSVVTELIAQIRNKIFVDSLRTRSNN